MGRYEERLEADLETLRERVVALGTTLGKTLEDATEAFTAVDVPLASRTIIGDHAINREVRSIDALCHAFVARHVPSAGHLRFVSSVMRINVALERIGDYAVTISREAAQMKKAPPRQIVRDIEMMSQGGRLMLAQALKAFHERSLDLARGTKDLAAGMNRAFHTVFHDLLRECEKDSREAEDLFGLHITLHRLRRVEAQAKNICEETIFILTGETKQPKTFAVLFVDERGDRLSPMAAAIARKAFPESGTYDSRGWQPADQLDPEVSEFLDLHNYDPPEGPPQRFDGSHEGLNAYKIVIGLQAGIAEHIEDLPFYTVLLEWDVLDGADATDAAALVDVQKRITSELCDLMEILRGEQAS